MKGKSLLAIAVIAAISSNVFAMEIVKGRLLEHKQSSANAFKQLTPDHNKLANLLNKHKNDIGTFVSANARVGMLPLSVNVGDSVNLIGTADMFISNYSSSSKKFTIDISICDRYSFPTIPSCATESDVIQLDPGGAFNLYVNPTLTTTYDTAGFYNPLVNVEIHNVDDNSTFYTDDFGTINVTDSVKK